MRRGNETIAGGASATKTTQLTNNTRLPREVSSTQFHPSPDVVLIHLEQVQHTF
jgi:hypothetical protein